MPTDVDEADRQALCEAPAPLSEGPEAEAFRRLQQHANALETENRLLREMLDLLRRKQYGPASEKLDKNQLELLEEEPGVHVGEVEGEAGKPPVTPASTEPGKRYRRRPHPGRRPLPESLPRVEKIVPADPEACTCGMCGGPTIVSGYTCTEELAVRPAEFFVRVVKREKRACRQCPEAGVSTAPAPPKIIEKSVASNELIVEILVGKYRDHLPIYRQCAGIAEDTGVELDRTTVIGWMMATGELLLPVRGAMRAELIAGDYIWADETTVGVQMHDHRRRNHQGYFFAYGNPEGTVVYDFRMGRARAGPKEFLEGYRGTLQTDGYSAYDKTGTPGCVVRVGCWAHARRKFHDMHQLDKDNADAKRMIDLFANLYAIEAEARGKGLDAEARGALRAERSMPIAEEIREAAIEIRARVLPKSILGKACTYLLGQWSKLERCLLDGRVEIDNNSIERAMRRIAVGRKNWIHIGSPQAAPKIAAILSIFETCKLLGIEVREYLLDVLPGMADRKISEVAQLTPRAWKAARDARMATEAAAL